MSDILKGSDTLKQAYPKVNKAFNDLQGNIGGVEQELADHKLDYTQQRQQDQLKVAKVEKELSDYKSTIAGINVNQEAKQKATGYGIVPLPKNAANGQVGGSVRGLTLSNLLNKTNSSYTNLVGSGSRVIIDKDGNLVVSATPNAKLIKIIQGNKYFIKFKIKQSSIGRIDDVVRVQLSDSVVNIKQNFVNTLETFALWTATETFDSAYFYTRDGLAGQIDLEYAFVYDLTASNLAHLTEQQANQILYYVNDTKSTVSAMRLKSVSEDESEVSMVYVTAKDSEDKIAELRSLPNGTKDEINVSTGTKTQRVSNSIIIDGNIPMLLSGTGYVNTYRVYSASWGLGKNIFEPTNNTGIAISADGAYTVMTTNISTDTVDKRLCVINGDLYIRVECAKVDAMAGADTLAKFKAYLNQYPITLTYQLAEPVEIPIEVSGSLVSHPNGTVYVEPVVADAGVYTDKIEVLHDDLPIKAIEKVSKVDFMTGVETELDIEGIVIAENQLSFTHPDLLDGDIVFFEYEYDVESTQGAAEIEYYDSRYTIKDSVTDKFYKWNVTVADGVPSIELVEV